MSELEAFYEKLENDPGDPVFTKIAEHHIASSQYKEALIVLLEGLTHNPNLSIGRILLARVYFELGFIPFAQREVEALSHELPSNKFLERLYKRIVPESIASTPEGAERSSPSQKSGKKEEDQTVAETEFDLDEIELLTDD